MRLAELRDIYFLSTEWRHLSPSSKRIYLQSMGYIEEFMGKNIDKINRGMVLDFRDANYEAKSKCRLGLKMLGTLLQFGYDRGYCSANHARGIKWLPPKVGYEPWTMAEVRKVLLSADQKVKDAINMALYTGQRRSDLVRIQWDNYDGTYIHVIQKKTKKPLAIPVHPVLKRELERMMNERVGPYILTNRSGDKWSEDYITKSVTAAARKAGVNKSIHGLRKTTASVLAESGCTPHEIAAITGQSIMEVMNYTRKADQRTLAERALERWKNM